MEYSVESILEYGIHLWMEYERILVVKIVTIKRSQSRLTIMELIYQRNMSQNSQENILVQQDLGMSIFSEVFIRLIEKKSKSKQQQTCQFQWATPLFRWQTCAYWATPPRQTCANRSVDMPNIAHQWGKQTCHSFWGPIDMRPIGSYFFKQICCYINY